MHPSTVAAITRFWEEFDSKQYTNIASISKEQFQQRHKNVLSLVGKYNGECIAWLIAGKYYGHIWSKPSTSRILNEYVCNNSDYMVFYQTASIYYYMMTMRSEITYYFEKMDLLDQNTASGQT